MKKIALKWNALAGVAILLMVACSNNNNSQEGPVDQALQTSESIVTGASRIQEYVPYLKNKSVGLVINNTSLIDGKLSMDTLLALGVNIVKGFGPEHGFRGDASAGAEINDEVDAKTGVPLVSLYGKKYKPSKEDIAGIDVMIFDMQDVGVRFYTYISTLHYIMDACAENDVELIVLDRPNPNDGYVDGPIREAGLESFIGMHPIPIAHGLTLGEYAKMINGQGWLTNRAQCKLKVVEMLNYHHGKPYSLPIPPSPNLNTQQAILLYPATCLFEGTDISEGRGTMFAFSIAGSPKLKGKYAFSYVPVSIPGMAEKPKHLNDTCYGLDLRNYDVSAFVKTGRINLSWIKELYDNYPVKEQFFKKSFSLLAGNNTLEQQIKNGISVEEIQKSWEPGLAEFKEMRKKYLIYK